MKKISVEQFEKESTGTAAQLLDVREKPEHAAERVEGFALYPLSGLSERSVGSLDKSQPTYMLCRSGNRACLAAEKLEKFGFKDVRVIEGGLGAWASAGKPVIKGSTKIWSLERQVRFAAGLLVGMGMVLSYAVHPYWIGLSAFVAAGLMFSALTDTCGMGMVLAKLPWNQK